MALSTALSYEGLQAILTSCGKQVLDLSSKIDECEEDAERLAALYAEKTKEAQELKEELQTLTQSLDSLYRTVAPITSVPDEILSMIFLEFVAEWECGGLRELEDWARLGRFLCAITGVSKRWKRVALATPRLWRNIWHTLKEDRVGSAYPSVGKCLARSRACPLSIRVFGYHRIKQLLKRLQDAKGMSRVIKLYLGEPGSDAVPDDLMTFLCALSYPNMETLTLEFINNVKRCALLSFLPQLPKLRTLTIYYTSLCSAEVPVPTAGSAILPNVECLRLLGATQEDAGELLTILSLPRLRHLQVDVEQMGDVWDDPTSLMLSCHSAALQSVEKLTLSGELTTADASRLLNHASRIHTLELVDLSDEFDFDDLLQTNLLVMDGAAPKHLLKQLRYLAIDRTRFSCDALRRLVDSRRQASDCPMFERVSITKRTLNKFDVEESQKLMEVLQVLEWTDAPSRVRPEVF